MKAYILLITYVYFCAGSVIHHPNEPTPGDNQHYVEGVSRYIWMPDGTGNPHLVDLHEPVNEAFLSSRNGANNQYWLFTRQNRNNAQILRNGDSNSVRNSNYRSNIPLKVIVHGWDGDGNSPMNPMITAAFLDTQDCNVIVVDWHQLADRNYLTAVSGVPDVGNHLGQFLQWLINNFGGNWNNVHLVGFSLGAHVVGNAGRAVGGQVRRVTGLDPAGPLWNGNSNALNRNSGRYVEAIHTDGGGLGIRDPIADADFFPNGGDHPQPGCWLHSCSHGRAPELFAASVYHNHLVGRQCVNIWEAELATCNGASLNMGNGNLSKSGSGLYGLVTGQNWPY